MQATIETAKRICDLLDHGLVVGMGKPKPGKMCVEAAVCYALDLPHGDNPRACVAQAPRRAKIVLNDFSWPNNNARAAGMKAVAVAQLGSAGVVDEQAFTEYLAIQIVRRILPIVLNAADIDSYECRKATTIKEAERAACMAKLAANEACAERAERAASVANAACVASAARVSHVGVRLAVERATRTAENAGVYAFLEMSRIILEALRICKSPGVAWVDELGLTVPTIKELLQ